MTKTVSIPEGPANELIQTLGTLLDETAALVWDATHEPETFDRLAAHHACLAIKAKAHAAVEKAFAFAAEPTRERESTFIPDGGGQLERVHQTMEVTPALVADEKALSLLVAGRLREALASGQNVLVIVRTAQNRGGEHG